MGETDTKLDYPFTGIEVIQRGIVLVQTDALEESFRDHGSCCPWCAISQAKGELDDDHGIKRDLLQALKMLFNDQRGIENPDDVPLKEARQAITDILPEIKEVAPPFEDKKWATDILEKALLHLKEKTHAK